MALRLIFVAVFFASGAAALLYQVIWQRLLTFTTGADVYSVTIVVAAFMAGMGVGSLAGGHVADRLSGRGRLVAFAACELAIAAVAFVSAAFYYDWLYARVGQQDLSLIARGGLSFLATLWPTFFMGMSLPLATRALTDDARQPARWVPILYGWNTLGAASGAVLAVAILFRRFDFVTSLWIGAGVSLTCGAIALWLSSRMSVARDDNTSSRPAAAATPPRAEWAHLREPILLYGLAGFIALALEVVWFRLLGVILKSNALTFGHLLAVYLGGLGLGSLMAQRPFALRLAARRTFLLSQAAIPIYAAGALAMFVALVPRVGALQPLWAHLGAYDGLNRDTWSGLTFALDLVVPIWLMGLPTFLMGFSFGFLQRSVQTDLGGLGRRVGWLQAANIAGAVLGAVVAGFVLLDAIGTSGTLQVLAALGGVFLWIASPPRWLWRIGTMAVVAAAVLAVPSAARLWPTLHGTSPALAVFAEDSSGVALLKSEDEGATAVHANGLGQSRLPFGGIHTALGALPMMVHPAPRRVAIIGLGSGDTTWAAGGRPDTEIIDSIEIVAPALTSLQELVRRRPYPGLRDMLLDRRIRHHLTDGRAFLLKSSERYDVIEADALRPTSAYAGNLYSVEYFSLLRARLAPGGFAVTWVPTSRVADSLAAAFPYVLVSQQAAIGSDQPIPFDVEAIRARIERPEIAGYYSRGGINIEQTLAPYLMSTPRLVGPTDPRSANLNRDLFPKDEFRVR